MGRSESAATQVGFRVPLKELHKSISPQNCRKIFKLLFLDEDSHICKDGLWQVDFPKVLQKFLDDLRSFIINSSDLSEDTESQIASLLQSLTTTGLDCLTNEYIDQQLDTFNTNLCVQKLNEFFEFTKTVDERYPLKMQIEGSTYDREVVCYVSTHDHSSGWRPDGASEWYGSLYDQDLCKGFEVISSHCRWGHMDRNGWHTVGTEPFDFSVVERSHAQAKEGASELNLGSDQYQIVWMTGQYHSW